MLHLNLHSQDLKDFISALTKTAGAKVLAVLVLNEPSPAEHAPSDSTGEDQPVNMPSVTNGISLPELLNAQDEISNLSPRERQIMNFLLKGYSHKMIAGELSISIHTVRNHITRIYRKMNVHSGQEAIARLLDRERFSI